MTAVERLAQANPVAADEPVLDTAGELDLFLQEVLAVEKPRTQGTVRVLPDRRSLIVPSDRFVRLRRETATRRWIRPVAAVAFLIVVGLIGAATLLISQNHRDSPVVANDGQDKVFATTVDDVVGTWRASGFPWYKELMQDGTHQYGVSRTRLDENLTGKPDGTFRFEGNLVYVESIECTLRDIAEPGIYRIRLLSPDLIQFEEIEETCDMRRIGFAIDSDTKLPVTWSRFER